MAIKLFHLCAAKQSSNSDRKLQDPHYRCAYLSGLALQKIENNVFIKTEIKRIYSQSTRTQLVKKHGENGHTLSTSLLRKRKAFQLHRHATEADMKVWVALFVSVLDLWCLRNAGGAEVEIPLDGDLRHHFDEAGGLLDAVSSSLFSSGIESAWPTQNLNPDLLEEKQRGSYKAFMKECYERSSKEQCQARETDRILANQNQPKQMTNFTSTGFVKIKTPEKAFQILQKAWRRRKKTLQNELWDLADTSTNQNTALMPLHEQISDSEQAEIALAVQKEVESFTGIPQRVSGIHGVRVYLSGSIIAPHVHPLPVAASAIIHIDQSVNEVWPLVLVDHQGKEIVLHLAPGDMVIYESHSVLLGRPYPLNGDYQANLLVQFTPGKYMDIFSEQVSNPAVKFDDLVEAVGTVEVPSRWSRLPPYIQDVVSQEAKQWRQDFVFQRLKPPKRVKPVKTSGVSKLHNYAAHGLLKEFIITYEKNPDLLSSTDSNGWTPLHEAARAGNKQIVEYIIQKGGKINERTNNGVGATPLWWAQQEHGEDHPVVRILREHGAVAIGPHGR